MAKNTQTRIEGGELILSKSKQSFVDKLGPAARKETLALIRQQLVEREEARNKPLEFGLTKPNKEKGTPGGNLYIRAGGGRFNFIVLNAHKCVELMAQSKAFMKIVTEVAAKAEDASDESDAE